MKSFKYLLLDDRIIEEKVNVAGKFNKFKKLDDGPLIVPDKKWEARMAACPCVLYDRETGRYRMWYDAFFSRNRVNAGCVCYAESWDGLNWEKPDCNAITYRGSKKNNVVLKFESSLVGHAGNVEVRDGFYTIAYWDCPEGYIRKRDPHPPGGICLAYSQDGIHWQKEKKNPVWQAYHANDAFTVFFDRMLNKYIVFPTIFCLDEEEKLDRRIIARAESRDLRHFSDALSILYPEKEEEGVQFYTMRAFNYGHLYLGFLAVYHTAEKDPECEKIVPELVWSRDSYHWTRTGHNVIDLGDAGAFDSGMIFFSAKEPLRANDKLYFYYTGWNRPHDATKDFSSSISAAVVRDDGFYALSAKGREEGFFTTVALPFRGGRLRLNVRSVRGCVKVELCRADGTPLPGFTKSDSELIKTDKTDHIVRWKGREKVELRSDKVRVRVFLRDSAVYAFQLEEGKE